MTENMWAILEVLKDGRMRTPNDIGGQMGVSQKQTGLSGTQYRSRGPGSIISPALTALRDRKLIWFGPRPDGLTGTAYHITERGLAKLEKKGQDHARFSVAWDGMQFDVHSELVRGEGRFYWVQMRPLPNVMSVRCNLVNGTTDSRRAKKLAEMACARYEASLPW